MWPPTPTIMRQCIALIFLNGHAIQSNVSNGMEWGQHAYLLEAEGFFVDSLDMLAPAVLTCQNFFTQWAWVLIIYAMRCQMSSHLA